MRRYTSDKKGSSTATTTVKVGHDVSATSGSGIEAVSRSDRYNMLDESETATSTAASTTTVTVGGDVTSPTGYGIEAESLAPGEYYRKNSTATATLTSTTTVTVGGDVTSAYGLDIDSNAGIDSTATTTVSVGGDVTSTSEYVYGIDAVSNAYIYDYGESTTATLNPTATTTVTVDGDVTSASGSGIDAVSRATIMYDGESTTATSTAASTTTVTVGGDVTSKYGSDIESYAGIDSTAATTVTVSGDVTSTSGYDVLYIYTDAYGKDSKATTTVTVGGDVTSTSTSGEGIYTDTYAYEGSTATTTLRVGGDVSTTGEDEVYGIYSYSYGDGTTTSIDVDGSVISKSNGLTEGIYVDGQSGTVDINVGGNVIQDGEDGFAIGIKDQNVYRESMLTSEPGLLGTAYEEVEDAPEITIKVAKDVIASNTAVEINKDLKESTVDLNVEGTIKGDDHSIVLGEESVADNLNITVWKIDTSNNQPIVQNKVYNEEKEEYEYTTNEVTKEVEENINYIIRVEKVETSGGNLVADKKTAHAGEDVYLEVTVPKGYEIDSFYNATGAANVDVISSGGKYYLKVPSGGGVFVGVSLKKLQNNASDNTSSSNIQVTPSADNVSRTESGASDGEYWSPGYNRNGNAGGVYVGYDTAQIQGLQVHSMSIGGDVVQNITDVLTPVDAITAMNNFAGTSIASIDMNNVMGSGVVNFNNLFINSISDTVDVPVPANVIGNQSYTVMFSDGTSMVVTCAMNGVLNIPFSKVANGLTYIIFKTQMDPSMFIGVPEATSWTY